MSSKLNFLYRPFFASETENFFDRLSMLMSAGVTIDSALDAIENESSDFIVKKCVRFVKEQIESGSTISKALENSNLFSEYVTSILKAGEASGRIVDYLELLAEQETKNRTFKSRVTSALMYPAIVFFVAMAVAVGISWFILPRLATVFVSMNAKLPRITEIVMQFGNYLGEHGAVAIPVFIVVSTFLFLVVFVFPKTKYSGQLLLFFTPGIGKLIMESEVARFTYLFGTLLKSGVPIGTSILSVSEVTPFFYYKLLYKHLNKKVNEGASFEQAFKSFKFSNKLFPPSVQQVFFSAEKSGRLADSLVKLSAKYEEKSSNTSKNLGTLIEPVFLVIVWAIVMFIALAVILPIYNLIGGINDRPESDEIVVDQGEASVVEIVPKESSVSEPVLLENARLQVVNTPEGELNVRKEPSVTSTVVLVAKEGDIFEFTDEQNNWFLIKLSETSVGWVNGEYVKQL